MDLINQQYATLQKNRRKSDNKKIEIANSGSFEGLISKFATNLASLKNDTRKKIIARIKLKRDNFLPWLDKISASHGKDKTILLKNVKELQQLLKETAEDDPEVISVIEKSKEFYNLLELLRNVIVNNLINKNLTSEDREFLRHIIEEGENLIGRADIHFRSTYQALRPILKLIQGKLNE